MNNLQFLNHINSIIFRNEDSTYYVYIPMVEFNQDNSYLENFDNGIYVKLSKSFLNGYELVNGDILLESTENSYSIFAKDDMDITSFEKTDSNKYEYYASINELIENGITEEQFMNFYITFMSIIEAYAEVQNQEDIKTQIYQKVIRYYSNNQTDDILTGLSLILKGQSYSYTDNSPYSNCGCNSTITTTGIVSQTATDLVTNVDCVMAYKQSMYLYLVQMLSDIDFYNNFMFVDDDPNEDLIDYLLTLIDSLLNMNLSLNFGKTTNNHCLCSELEEKNTNNYNILENYKKVLNWVKNCEIEENTNKIKIYGKQFAEILTYLQF